MTPSSLPLSKPIPSLQTPVRHGHAYSFSYPRRKHHCVGLERIPPIPRPIPHEPRRLRRRASRKAHSRLASPRPKTRPPYHPLVRDPTQRLVRRPRIRRPARHHVFIILPARLPRPRTVTPARQMHQGSRRPKVRHVRWEATFPARASTRSLVGDDVIGNNLRRAGLQERGEATVRTHGDGKHFVGDSQRHFVSRSPTALATPARCVHPMPLGPFPRQRERSGDAVQASVLIGPLAQGTDEVNLGSSHRASPQGDFPAWKSEGGDDFVSCLNGNIDGVKRALDPSAVPDWVLRLAGVQDQPAHDRSSVTEWIGCAISATCSCSQIW